MSLLEQQLMEMFPRSDLDGDDKDLIKAKLLSRAIAISAYCHRNMVDKGGKPYITHPIRIMMRLRTDNEQLMILAMLHDVVEDCDVSLFCLEMLGFDVETLKYLEILSHTDHSVTYEEYIRRIGEHIPTTLIKLEDLRDNSDITRKKDLREKDFARLKKYHTAHHYLTNRLHEMLQV